MAPLDDRVRTNTDSQETESYPYKIHVEFDSAHGKWEYRVFERTFDGTGWLKFPAHKDFGFTSRKNAQKAAQRWCDLAARGHFDSATEEYVPTIATPDEPPVADDEWMHFFGIVYLTVCAFAVGIGVGWWIWG